MFELLKSVYGFVCLDNKQRLLMLTERSYKHNHRCDQCEVYACHHEMDGLRKHNRLPLTDCAHTVQLGENIGSVMNNVQITERSSERRFPIRKSESEGSKSDLPLSTPVSATEMKAPLEKLPGPLKVEGPNVSLEEKDSVKKIVMDEFIRCGICEGRVYWEFLTEHHKWHVYDFQPDKKYTPASTTTSTSRHTQTSFGHTSNATALARTNTPSTSSSSSTSVHTNSSTNKKTTKTTTVSTTKPRSFTQYKFRPIDGMAAFSSTSKDGHFSDISLVAWLPEKTRIESHGYAGGGYSAVKDFERFVMTITHNNQDDYYVISSKIVKRGQWSTYEFDELLVADRICTQEELLDEMKRIILFYGLSPRAFYKRFRKLFKQDIIVETKNGRLVARTESSNTLNDRLSGKSTSTVSIPQKDEPSDNDKWHCGCG